MENLVKQNWSKTYLKNRLKNRIRPVLVTQNTVCGGKIFKPAFPKPVFYYLNFRIEGQHYSFRTDMLVTALRTRKKKIISFCLTIYFCCCVVKKLNWISRSFGLDGWVKWYSEVYYWRPIKSLALHGEFRQQTFTLCFSVIVSAAFWFPCCSL